MSQTKAQLIDPTDGSIVNADINASAAIAGTKISPNFGSQTVTTTGVLNTNNITITAATPSIVFSENDANPDFQISQGGGALRIEDVTNGYATRLTVNSDGHVDILGNLDVGAGLDVTGAIGSTGNLTITNTQPKIFLTDSNNTSDFSIQNENGNFNIFDETNSASRVRIISTGLVGIGQTAPGHLLHLKGTDTAYSGSVAVGPILELEDAAGRKSQFIAPGAVGEAGAGTPTNHDFTLFSNNTERMRIKNSGDVGIGTAAPDEKLHVAGNIINTTSVSGTGDSGIQIANNHRLGFDQSGTRSWSIKADGGVLKIDSGDGNSAPQVRGILFNSDTADANKLNDYEEGSWTPTTVRWSVSESTTNAGKYTKIGNFVQISWNQSLTATNGGYNGNGSGAAIGGLPFGIADCAVVSFSNSTLWTNQLDAIDNIGNELFYRPNKFSAAGIATDAMFNASGVVKLTATYRTND